MITFTGDAAGVVTFNLTQNGTPLVGALASETITTADTEVRTVTIDFFVLVDSACVLGTLATIGSNIGVTNTGTVDATVTNYVLNIEKSI